MGSANFDLAAILNRALEYAAQNLRVEKLLIQKALARYAGNVNRAAEALGLSRSALYRRLQHYGL